MIWPPFVIAALMRDEGFRGFPYKDSVGVTTIGFGRNLEANPLTRDEAEHLLVNDLADTVERMDRLMPWFRGLDAVRQGVMINMAFNLGVLGLLTFKNTLKAVREARYDDAADGMLKSKWAQQVGQRAVRLAQEMKTGVTV